MGSSPDPGLTGSAKPRAGPPGRLVPGLLGHRVQGESDATSMSRIEKENVIVELATSAATCEVLHRYEPGTIPSNGPETRLTEPQCSA
ncbi:unnamed protein product [Gadus morhua 'NCC']